MPSNGFNPEGTVVTPQSPQNDVLPLNSTVPNLNSGVTARNTLTAGTAQTVTFDTKTSNIEFIPGVAPTGPIFIKRGTAAGQTVASATNFDEIITPCKPAIQVGVTTYCTSYSIYSGLNQTVYTIER